MFLNFAGSESDLCTGSKTQGFVDSNLIVSAPISAWEVKLEIMTDRPYPTNQPNDKPSNQRTDRQGHREVSLSITYL